jgi:hypothetical protein
VKEAHPQPTVAAEEDTGCGRSASSTAASCSDVGDPCSDDGACSDEDEPPVRTSTKELTWEVPQLLERMNDASTRVNKLERLTAAAEERYRSRLLHFERMYKLMRAEFGGAFDSAKPLLYNRGGPCQEAQELAPCFQALRKHEVELNKERELLLRLTCNAQDAKAAYTASMRQLEAISSQVHENRRFASRSSLSASL